MLGLFYILLCWLLGNTIGCLTGGYVSGNIIGMILLYLALHFRLIEVEKVRPAAKFLLGSMALFFVPYGVGLMVSYKAIIDNFWAIVAASAISTVAVMLTVGWLYQQTTRKK